MIVSVMKEASFSSCNTNMSLQFYCPGKTAVEILFAARRRETLAANFYRSINLSPSVRLDSKHSRAEMFL